MAVGATLATMLADGGTQHATELMWDYFHKQPKHNCPLGKVPASIGLQLTGSSQSNMSNICVEAMK